MKYNLTLEINKHYEEVDRFIERIIYMIGDSPTRPSEDDLLNALIGFQSQQKWSREIVHNTINKIYEEKATTNQ